LRGKANKQTPARQVKAVKFPRGGGWSA